MGSCLHALVPSCRPTGPAHRPSLSIFFIFHVHRISRPRCWPGIPGIDSDYSHWASARDGPSLARACPPSRPSTPHFHVSRRSKAPFFSRSFNLRNAVFQPQLFWAPVGFCGVGHHGITKLSSSVMSSCPTPQNPTGTGPALWSCWVPLNVFRCRIPAPIPAD